LYVPAVSDVVRRRIAALLLVAGCVVAALAIADVGPFEDPITEDERVTDAVEAFFAAASSGDGETFCDGLTRDARQALGVTIAQQLQADDPLDCADAFKVLALVFKGSSTDIRSVSVSGLRARVEIRLKPAKGAAKPRTIMLAEEDGEWYVADLGD
jgi:hypothetical protein